jgi:putative flippase GtrA
MTEQKRPPRTTATSEFIRFLITGLANTITTYVLYLVLLSWVPYLFAYSVGYVAGIVLSYFLNALFVFRIPATRSGLIKFPVVYVIQYLVGGLVLWICVERLGVPREIGLALSIGVTVPITYAAAKYVLTGPSR